MRFRFIHALFVACGLACLASPLSAAIIGVKYARTTTLLPEEIAGAPGFAQAFWNNSTTGGQGPGSLINGLLSSDGSTTGVNLTEFTLSVPNSWHYGTHDTPDQKLMDDFADKNPTLTFTGLDAFAPNGYSVVVYYGNNEFGAAGGSTVTANAVSEIVKSGPDFVTIGGYVQDLAGPGVAVSDRSNYVVLPGVTGDVLNVSLTSNQNDGIMAVQIVPNAAPVPEPSTFALAGVALVGAAFYRMRRRGE